MNTPSKTHSKPDAMFLIAGILILLAVASRLLPHPMNFTPIGAIGLFAGAYFSRGYYWLLPITALLLGDALIGFYQPLVMLFVYAGFAFSGVIGRLLLSQSRALPRMVLGALSSATVFFVLSNFGLWLSGLYYPMTEQGLIECFIMAIPFYGNTLAGDLFYACVLFAAYEAIKTVIDRAYDSASNTAW